MKKTTLFLWGILSVLFFVSCSKEQLKPSAGSSIVQKPIAERTGLNGGSTISPTRPPMPYAPSGGNQTSGTVHTASGSHTVLNGESNVSPTPPTKP